MGIIFIFCSNDKPLIKTFSIYLKGSHELIISDKHINAYYRDTHEIELNAEGVKRIRFLKELRGKDFVVKVNDTEIYKGKFWSKIYSSINPGVIINDAPRADNDKIKIDFGYPSTQYATDKDPRNNQEIMDCFKEKGILK